MVLFENINIRARVEVLWRGTIHGGTVRYRGALVGRSGEWIGVELDQPVSAGNSGLHYGVQYFTCRHGHGIFTHATNIRFKHNKRTLYNNYRTVAAESSIETTLFHSQVKFLDKSSEREPEPSVVTSQYLKDIFDKDTGIKRVSRPGFHKKHLIGHNMRPATASPPRNTSTSQRLGFISPASILATHVPRPALQRMIKQDYFGTTIPRYTSLS